MLGGLRLLGLRTPRNLRYASSSPLPKSKLSRFVIAASTATGVGVGVFAYVFEVPLGEIIDSALPDGWELFHKQVPAITRPHVILPLEPRIPAKSSEPPKKEEKLVEAKKDPTKTITVVVKKKVTPEEAEESLLASLASSEAHVKKATQAKAVTIDTIDGHVHALKHAIEGGLEGDWERVRTENERVKKARKEDISEENDARNYIDSLKKMIEDNSQLLTDNPILQSAKVTAEKLNKELDEMSFSVKMLESEQIFALEYADLVQQARGRFADELRAVLPSFDWDNGSKMKKKQLNALLAHAHLRLDQIQRDLIQSKLSEESRVESAIREQMKKRSDEMKEEAKKDHDKEASAKLNEEFMRRLAQMEEEHNTRLEMMMKAQRKLAKMEKEAEVEEARCTEKQKHVQLLNATQAKIDGIEEFLTRRVYLDAENRRVKLTWLACHELSESVEFGQKGGMDMQERRRPIGQLLSTMITVSEGDEFVSTVVNAVSDRAKNEGEYTRMDMQTRFRKVYNIGRRVAFIGEDGDSSISSYVFSWIRSFFTFAMPYKGDEKLDWTRQENVVLLDTACSLVKQRRFLEAARLLSLLKGESGRVSSDWHKDLRSLEESLFLVRLLTIHSALQSIRSTY